jgi:hypothetical protein
MHATLRWYPDSTLADGLAARADEIRSVIGEVPGFQAYYLVKGDQGTISITVCDDEAGTTASNQVAASWLRENMPDLGGGAPNIAAGEVVISV